MVILRVLGSLLVLPGWVFNLLVLPLTIAQIPIFWPFRLAYDGLASVQKKYRLFFLIPVLYVLYFVLLLLSAIFEVLFLLAGLPYSVGRWLQGNPFVLRGLLNMRTASFQLTLMELTAELPAGPQLLSGLGMFFYRGTVNMDLKLVMNKLKENDAPGVVDRLRRLYSDMDTIPPAAEGAANEHNELREACYSCLALFQTAGQDWPDTMSSYAPDPAALQAAVSRLLEAHDKWQKALHS